ncbi:crotonase/enoyl-CoA hydratase family protein [Sneathiella sp. HT1-7]|uniref:crotonase/enoyl-CoA hydratase family protein n=1 Tax=Sneathiella sp. HT1-7 TaxID=2887192 RepID=UPI001D137D30|nr:crotonase/enoyl-CoA hydratase family protein [Sneathiella sp. HT1-7]MCC3303232.1 crotonase/enoyl-CoA hydratase family protein [Sneathiella sp. HT1-7]
MTYSCFDVQIKNQIAHIILNRPEKRNSMIPAFWNELPEIVRDIDENAKARVIVISSTGPHFSSGLDVASFVQPEITDPKEKRASEISAGAAFYGAVKNMQQTFTALQDCRLPVLAAIQGGCIGGGVDLITACDMRYATEDAFITIFETNIGMTADVGTFPRITKVIGDGLARELAYTGRRMPANEAKSAGLFNTVYKDQEALLGAVMEIAKEIASKAPLAIMGCKRMMNYSRDHSIEDSLDYIAIWNASMLQREEIFEAMKANAEKRPAEFVELPPIQKNIG